MYRMEKPRLRGVAIILECSCMAVVPRGGLEDGLWGKAREWQVGWATLPGIKPRCCSSWQSSPSGGDQCWASRFLSGLQQNLLSGLCVGSPCKTSLMAFVICITCFCGLRWGECPCFNLAEINKSEQRNITHWGEPGLVTPLIC